ncbi:alpha/beta hydrolase [Vogesella indigofera]|uniref:alpha/beta hydrolase n=1 Tax=Vogesella indigofera TaxID=45465 RepID=UPI00234F4274|nr:phospholipase [Vogesella indigofera]MDC7700729.1 phospholipase [Vogesella indigofera]
MHSQPPHQSPSLPTQQPSALRQDAASGLLYRVLQADTATAPQLLLLLLHGVGGNEGQLTALGQQLDARVRVVLVQAPLAFGPGQFGWFQVSFGAQGPAINPAQAEASRQQLQRLVTSLQADSGLGAAQTVVAGFSQGGIMSAGLALTSPQLVGGFGLLSGRILPEIAPLLAAPQDLATLAGFISHGEFDDKLPLAWAEKAERWLNELGVPHQLQRYPAGHQLTAAMVQDFCHWLAARWLH